MPLPVQRGDREFQKFVEDLAGNVAVRTVVVDASGADVAHAEDSVHTSGDVGIQHLAVRNDVLAALAGADGDYAPIQVNALGAQYVALSAGGAVILDDAAFTPGTSEVVAAGYFADEAAPDSVDEGDIGAARMTLTRKQYTAPDQSHDDVVTAYASMGGLEAKDFDGVALPNSVAEGDIARIAGTRSGIQYVMVVNEDGSSRPAYDSGTDSFRGFEVNPLSEHHVEETLADVTNETDGTFNFFVDMDGYKHFSLQSILSGGSGTVTLTILASNQDDGTAAASATYIDVTNLLFGVANTTASAMWLADTVMSFKFLDIRIVAATGGSNDGDYTLYFKKLY